MGLSTRWFLGGGFTAVMWLTGHFTLRSLFLLAGSVMALFLYVLWAYQESLLYQPKVFPQYTRPQDNPPGYRQPSEQGMPYEDVYMDTPDGFRLHAWWIRPDPPAERRLRATLVFFHANAGNMGFRLDNIKQMYHDFKLNVFILSYRGYGNSTGTPTEGGILLDAETTWQHVTHRDDVDTNRIIVFGRSLGGSVAIALASKHCKPHDASEAAAGVGSGSGDGPYVCGLIVENTFTSISSLVNTLFPLLSPLKPLILRLDWPAIQRIALVTCPILLLSGQLDEVVPAAHMQDLYDAAVRCRSKEILKVKTGLHNNTWSEGGAEYKAAVILFLSAFVGVDVEGSGRQLTEDEIAEKKEKEGLIQRPRTETVERMQARSVIIQLLTDAVVVYTLRLWSCHNTKVQSCTAPLPSTRASYRVRTCMYNTRVHRERHTPQHNTTLSLQLYFCPFTRSFLPSRFRAISIAKNWILGTTVTLSLSS